MATEKKYVSLSKLTQYDGKIKGVITAGDAQTLADAKAYADSLAPNYDAAGAAATAEANAKSYTDGEVAKANTAAAGAQSAAEAAATAASTADSKAVAAQAAADAAQSEIDALETLVGTLPEGTSAKDVVDYVNVKTSGIATDAALGELQGQLAGAQEAIDAIEADYLKTADKDELQGNIDAVDARVTTLIGEDANKSVRTIANEELVAQIIPEAAKESLDTLEEIAAWIQSHPDDASAMNKAIEDLEALVGTLPEGIDQTTVVAYVEALVAAEKARAEGIEAGLESRLQAVEGAVGESGSVADDIATAKQEAIDAAASAADAKDEAILAAAKKYADDEDANIESRVDALETASGTHALKSEVEAVAGRVTTLEGEMDTAQGDIDAVEALAAANDAAIKALQTAVAGKASQADLDAAVARIATNEAEIASFVEVSEAEINALFA